MQYVQGLFPSRSLHQAHAQFTERHAEPLKERQDSCKMSLMDLSTAAAAPTLGTTTPARGMMTGKTKKASLGLHALEGKGMAE